MKGVAQRPVDVAAARAERAVAGGFARAGEVADGVGAALGVGEQVEPAAAAPGVAREYRGGVQREGVGQRGAGVVEQRLEGPAHGEYGRARRRSARRRR
jgi:hypothetical protein